MHNTKTLYMNAHTGSVDTLENWEKDFEDREDKSLSWEEWGGEDLEECAEAICTSFNLWQDYFDVMGYYSEEEFDAMTLEEKMEELRKSGYAK